MPKRLLLRKPIPSCKIQKPKWDLCSGKAVTIAYSSLGLTPNSSNVLSAVQMYRSVEIVLTTEHEIYCEITDQTIVSWNVYKFDDDPRNSVPVTGLRKNSGPYRTIHLGAFTTRKIFIIRLLRDCCQCRNERLV